MALGRIEFNDKIIGCFTNKETGKYFEYVQNDSGIFSDCPFQIFVGPESESMRFAKVLKTVAYIVVDEDEHGDPVFEKWGINHQWSKVI